MTKWAERLKVAQVELRIAQKFFNQGMQAAAQECFSRFYKNRA